MNSGIYKLIWDNNNYFYIGQSSNLIERKKCHIRHLKYKWHYNNRLQKVYNKYGIPKFTIIEYCENLELDNREQYYLDLHFNDKNCCNLSPTASSNRGMVVSIETRQKISDAKTDTKLSNQHKESISNGLKNAYKNGRTHHFLGTKSEENPFYGKNHTDATKLKLRGKRKSVSMGKNPKARLCINLETGIFYDCVSEAAISYGFNFSTLYNRIYKGKETKIIFI